MATEKRKIILETGVDGSGAKAGFEQIKAGAKDMAQAVGKSGSDAAKGLGAIGEATEKLSSTQSRFVEQVRKNAIVAEQGRAAFLEQKGAILGVSDVVAPYIAKLKQAEQGQVNLGMSAKATAASLRGVPAQFTDIVTSLQGGQAPLTVFLQQGGQLKDMFGGAGNAARALGGYILGLVNPLTLTAAAAGGLAFAMAKAESSLRESNGLAIQIAATGRSADISRDQLESLKKELALLPGLTKASAQEVLAEFAKTRQIGGSLFSELAKSVADFAAATGTTAPEAAKTLAQAFADPAKGAKQLEEQLGLLTASQVLTIEKMTELGDKAGAQQVLLDALTASTKGLADKGTDLQRATNAFGNAWDSAMTSLGNSQGLRSANTLLADTIGKVAWLIENASKIKLPGDSGSAIGRGLNTAVGMAAGGLLGGPLGMLAGGAVGSGGPNKTAQTGGATGSWESSTKAIDDQAKALLGVTAGYESAAGSMKKMRDQGAAIQTVLQGLRAAGKGASAEAVELASRLEGVNEKIKAAEKRAAGPKASTAGESEVARINATIRAQDAYIESLRTRGVEAKKLTSEEQLVFDIQERLKGSLDGVARANALQALAAAKVSAERSKTIAGLEAENVAQKALTRAQEDFEKQRNRGLMATEAEIASITAKAQAIEDEIAVYGMGKEAVAQLTIARLEEQKAVLAGFPGSEAAIAQIDKEIAARQRLAKADDALVGLKDSTAESKKALSELDAFLDPGKAKDFGTSLRDAFGEAGNALARLANGLQDYGQAQAEIARERAKLDKIIDPAERAQREIALNKKSTQSQVSGYASVAGAAKGFFKEHTKGYDVMSAAEKTFRAFEVGLALESMAKQLFVDTAVTASKVSSIAAGTAAVVASVGPEVAANTAKAGAAGTAALASS
ncbi:MAG: hypothetical protein EOO22_08320, partial [Comamonadaceae bacterium]